MIYYIYADNKQEFIEKTKVYAKAKEVVYLPISRLAELDVTEVTHFVQARSARTQWGRPIAGT